MQGLSLSLAESLLLPSSDPASQLAPQLISSPRLARPVESDSAGPGF